MKFQNAELDYLLCKSFIHALAIIFVPGISLLAFINMQGLDLFPTL